MKVKMKVQISGTRDGAAWPAPGDTVDVPDAEGARLCANGSASPVAAKEKTEKATADDDVEERETKPARSHKG